MHEANASFHPNGPPRGGPFIVWASVQALLYIPAVSTNGARKPPCPRIELVGGNPTEEEAAAVMAALEQFLAETAPSPAVPEQSRWQRAALVEGVNREPAARRWGGGP